MSENLRGVIEIEMNADRFVSGGTKARQALSGLNEETQKTNRSLGQNSTTLIAAAATASTAVFAYKNLGDMQLQVDKAARRVEEAHQRLIKTQNNSKASAQDLADANRDLRIAEEQHKQILDNVQQAQIQFGISLAGLAATTIPSAVKAITGLIASHGLAAAATGGHAAATVGLTRATWAWNLSLLANPFFAIPTAIAIGAAIGLVATNQWGLRDAIFGTTQAVKENTKAYGQAPPALEGYSSGIGTVTSTLKENTRATKADMESMHLWMLEYKNVVDTVKKNDQQGYSVEEIAVRWSFIDPFARDIELRELRRRIAAGLPTTEQGKAWRAADAALKRARVLQERLRATNLERNIGAPGGFMGDLDFADASAFIAAMFANVRESGAFSQSVALHGNLVGFGGISQAAAGRAAQGQLSSLRAAARSRSGGRVGVSTKAGSVGKGGRRGRRGSRVDPWKVFLERDLPKIIGRSGLDEETAQRLAQMAITGQGSSADRSRRAIPFSFSAERFSQLVAEEKERRIYAPFGGKELVFSQAGQLNVSVQDIMRIRGDPRTENDVIAMLAYKQRELLVSTSV